MDPTENFAVGFYLLIIGRITMIFSCSNHSQTFIDIRHPPFFDITIPKYNCLWFILCCIAVFVSFLFNLLVIVVITLRRKKLESTDVFIIALAVTDMMFSLAIHPMLIATSFGANSFSVFTTSGGNVIFSSIKQLWNFRTRAPCSVSQSVWLYATQV